MPIRCERGEVGRYYRPGLDAVRFAAFAAVFVHHGLPWRSTYTSYGAFVRACSFGLSLFFVLSAYLITSLLLRERETTGTVSLANFYRRRALRILPLYFAALAASASIGILRHNIQGTAAWYLAAVFMMGNVIWWVATPVHHLWSISVEEQFYVFWPTLMGRFSLDAVRYAALALIAIANSFLIYYTTRGEDFSGAIWSNSFINMEFFGAGILLALHSYEHPARAWSPLARTMALAGAACGFYFAVRFLHASGNPGEHAVGPVTICAGYALVAVCSAAIVLAMEGVRQCSSVLVSLGKVSYGLYVFHVPAISLTDHLLKGAGAPVRLAFALALTIPTAYLSYEFLEKVFLRMKQRYEVVQARPV